jgi:hypothetical protein
MKSFLAMSEKPAKKKGEKKRTMTHVPKQLPKLKEEEKGRGKPVWQSIGCTEKI